MIHRICICIMDLWMMDYSPPTYAYNIAIYALKSEYLNFTEKQL